MRRLCNLASVAKPPCALIDVGRDLIVIDRRQPHSALKRVISARRVVKKQLTAVGPRGRLDRLQFSQSFILSITRMFNERKVMRVDSVH